MSLSFDSCVHRVCDVRLASVISRLAPQTFVFVDATETGWQARQARQGTEGEVRLCGRGVLTRSTRPCDGCIADTLLLVLMMGPKRRPATWALRWTDVPWDVTIMTARVRQLADSRQRTREGKPEQDFNVVQP